jgi:hypothetical protein
MIMLFATHMFGFERKGLTPSLSLPFILDAYAVTEYTVWLWLIDAYIYIYLSIYVCRAPSRTYNQMCSNVSHIDQALIPSNAADFRPSGRWANTKVVCVASDWERQHRSKIDRLTGCLLSFGPTMNLTTPVDKMLWAALECGWDRYGLQRSQVASVTIKPVRFSGRCLPRSWKKGDAASTRSRHPVSRVILLSRLTRCEVLEGAYGRHLPVVAPAESSEDKERSLHAPAAVSDERGRKAQV